MLFYRGAERLNCHEFILERDWFSLCLAETKLVRYEMMLSMQAQSAHYWLPTSSSVIVLNHFCGSCGHPSTVQYLMCSSTSVSVMAHLRHHFFLSEGLISAQSAFLLQLRTKEITQKVLSHCKMNGCRCVWKMGRSVHLLSKGCPTLGRRRWWFL